MCRPATIPRRDVRRVDNARDQDSLVSIAECKEQTLSVQKQSPYLSARRRSSPRAAGQLVRADAKRSKYFDTYACRNTQRGKDDLRAFHAQVSGKDTSCSPFAENVLAKIGVNIPVDSRTRHNALGRWLQDCSNTIAEYPDRTTLQHAKDLESFSAPKAKNVQISVLEYSLQKRTLVGLWHILRLSNGNGRTTTSMPEEYRGRMEIDEANETIYFYPFLSSSDRRQKSAVGVGSQFFDKRMDQSRPSLEQQRKEQLSRDTCPPKALIDGDLTQSENGSGLHHGLNSYPRPIPSVSEDLEYLVHHILNSSNGHYASQALGSEDETGGEEDDTESNDADSESDSGESDIAEPKQSIPLQLLEAMARHFIDDGVGGTCDSIHQAVVTNLSQRQNTNYGHEIPANPSGGFSHSQSSNSGMKRKRPSNEIEEETDESDGPYGQAPRLRAKQPPSPRTGRGLGCPFNKKDPEKFCDSDPQYKTCPNPIKDTAKLMQHLKEVHYYNRDHCFRCLQKCKDMARLFEHMRDGESCQVIPKAEIETHMYLVPNTDRKKRLDNIKKKRRDESEDDHWRLIWDALFPGIPSPDPYHAPPPGEVEFFRRVETVIRQYVHQEQLQYQTSDSAYEEQVHRYLRQVREWISNRGSSFEELFRQQPANFSAIVWHLLQNSRDRVSESLQFSHPQPQLSRLQAETGPALPDITPHSVTSAIQQGRMEQRRLESRSAAAQDLPSSSLSTEGGHSDSRLSNAPTLSDSISGEDAFLGFDGPQSPWANDSGQPEQEQSNLCEDDPSHNQGMDDWRFGI